MFKPEAAEFNPYYGKYLDLVPEADIREAFVAQPAELREAMKDLPEDRGTFAYDEGKWTIKEVISHLTDCERIFAYRMHRISRGDTTPIEGFDHDLIRQANCLMLDSMDEADLKRIGTANDSPISVRALAGIMLGHVRHHLNILKERYLA